MDDHQILDVLVVANEDVEDYRGSNKKGLIFKWNFRKLMIM